MFIDASATNYIGEDSQFLRRRFSVLKKAIKFK